MIDENRVLTACGLQQLQKTKNLGLRTLLKKVQRSNLHTVSGIVFGVAPWINAVGRLSHAKYALELLLATGKEEAERGVDLLEQENQARKKLDDTLLNEALAMVKKDGREKDSSLILFSPDWHKGILGIGAARCVEAHYKPTILLTQQKDQAVGSARSVVGYNIYEALKKCSDLFTAFGGHAYAAGLSLPLKNLPVFQQRFEAVVRETMSEAQRYPKQIVDTVIDLAQITPKFYNIIERMRPFGPGFRQPVFATGPIIVPKYTVYKEKHVALQVKQPSERTLWRAIGFNMAHLLPYIVGKEPLSIAYTIDRNKYNGWTRYELVLKDIKPYQPATAQ